jgi:L-glutamine-phosphate cytidylyltransferase
MPPRHFLILSGGVGSRLLPLTRDIPKSMVLLDGIPIVEHTLRAIAPSVSCGELRVSVVIGYRGEKLYEFVQTKYPFVNCVWEHNYGEVNNIFALFLGLASVHPASSLTSMNGDCVYDPVILNKAIKSDDVSSIFCDEAKPYSSESMKIKCSGGIVVEISKAIPEPEASSVSCDLYTLTVADKGKLQTILFGHVHSGDFHSFSEVALDEAVRGRVIHFVPRSVDKRFWWEIDTIDDLRAAQRDVSSLR